MLVRGAVLVNRPGTIRRPQEVTFLRRGQEKLMARPPALSPGHPLSHAGSQ